MSVIPARVLRLSIAAALFAAGLVTVGSGPGSAAAVPCQRTFSGDSQEIVGGGPPTIATIDVPEDGLVVTDVDVSVDLHHTTLADLGIEAKSFPDDESFVLSTLLYSGQRGMTGVNLLGTVFDDEATVPISWGSAPYAGRFLPYRPLADIEGLAGGTYELLIANFGATTGTLDGWSVKLTYASCDFDSDGVEDHRDSCLGVDAHTATGCPLTSRSLTATYRLGKFKGALSSPVAGCKAHRSVTVWKVRSGADRKVGTATTRSDGSYRLTRAKRLGRYYATSPRVAVTGVAECPAVTSKTFRIR